MLKRTALFEEHQQAGGKLIEFGGWEMPVQYTSIMDEHHKVRAAGGLFDISHMGEFMVSGKHAGTFLNRALTNDTRKLEPGAGQYSLVCNERGGVVDDLYVYRLTDRDYLLIVNASRIDADWAWLDQQAEKFGRTELELQNVSDQLSAIAVQGPKVKDFIDRCFSGASQAGTRVAKPSDLKKNQIGTFTVRGRQAFVARTGYTGEDGFEVLCDNGGIVEVWRVLLEVGKAYGLVPAGLGARDTLRTEVCYPLYGHELNEEISPIEAGLGFFVAFDKGEFFGRDVLLRQKESGPTRRCVAFKMIDKSAPPRPGYPIWSDGSDGAKIGEVVSGTLSPSLNLGIGLGYVPAQFAAVDTRLQIEVRGRKFAAAVVKKPIYKKPEA